MCLKKNFKWRNNISFKKDFLKSCVITNEKLDTNYCQDQGSKCFVHVCIMHQTSIGVAEKIS